MDTFKKPEGMKYTDMCIYIDANMHKVVNPNEFPQIEANIYKYLYLIVKALAIKQHLFKDWSYYDDFALYSAGDLFMTMRKKHINKGKIIRGKLVEPVKSCLNFIKSVLYPLKVNFEKNRFDEVINPEIDSRFNSDALQESMRLQVRSQYITSLDKDLEEILKIFPKKIYNMLKKESPFKTDKLMLKRIYISCLLSFINKLSLPNKDRKRIEEREKYQEYKNVISLYTQNDWEILLWHLEPGMENYIRILLVKIQRLFTDELNTTRSRFDLSDEVIDGILKTAFKTYDNNQGEY